MQADQELAEQEIGSADQLTEKLLEERDSLKDQLLRALADLENLRRRSERDLQAARKYGHVSFARDLLASIDNLGPGGRRRSAGTGRLDEGLVNLLVGLEMVVRGIDSVLEKHQIRPINPLGENLTIMCIRRCLRLPRMKRLPARFCKLPSPAICWMTACCALRWLGWRKRQKVKNKRHGQRLARLVGLPLASGKPMPI